MQENLEYWLVRAVAGCLGRMPRGLARLAAYAIAFAVYWCFGRLRRVGVRNLEMALPEALVPSQKKNSQARISSSGLATGRVLPHGALYR